MDKFIFAFALIVFNNAYALEKNFSKDKLYYLSGKLKKFGESYYFAINEDTGNEQLLKIKRPNIKMFEHGIYELCFKNSFECSYKCEIDEIKFFKLLPPVAKAKFYKPDPQEGIVGDKHEDCL